MEVGNQGRRARSSLSQINVTPFVDVMLVLLIIFMVTAPMLDQGVQVDLPEVEESPGLPAQQEPLVVTMQRDGKIFIGKAEVKTISKLGPVLQQALKGKPDREVFLEADQKVPYGRVVQVMAAVKRAGIEKLGMVTRLPEE
ncbi:Cell division and transport-associated protein TolR [Malonomonas rubra DSM 5091]|uniref:Cell division and transport-associated protein TolR n=1 Tax=Malonomonas rubra DSM 5091 TaxID=1122189 RepID=A0A1M6JRM8_MALRU|nr:protein TolR [Malonomonas rubra]SHJ49425.1 Cell division and transport-associated protein TolR [Malonomonas rubra DSM 5091]